MALTDTEDFFRLCVVAMPLVQQFCCYDRRRKNGE